MIKILVIVPFPMSEENLNSRRDQLKAVKLASEVKFEFRSTKAAPKNYISETDMVLADIGILEVGIKAQKEGFSAVCIDTMSDSGVSALRSCLDIPVIGPGQTSMLCAMMMGNKFSIVTMWKSWFHLYNSTIKRLGIKDYVASIRCTRHILCCGLSLPRSCESIQSSAKQNRGRLRKKSQILENRKGPLADVRNSGIF